MVRQRSKLLVVKKAMIEARKMHGLAKIDFVIASRKIMSLVMIIGLRKPYN